MIETGTAGPRADACPAGLNRRVLRMEVLVVLAVGVAPWTASAIVLLVKYLMIHRTTPVLSAVITGHPLADSAALSFDLIAGCGAAALVAYLLRRSGESLATLGASRPDFRRGLRLALLLLVGLLATDFVVAVVTALLHTPSPDQQLSAGINRLYLPPVLIESVRAGLLEELLVCGYLLHRLRQLGWSDRKALAASTLIRASYHVYGGIPLLALIVPMGLVFGRIYQKTQRLAPLILAHALYDSVLLTVLVAHR